MLMERDPALDDLNSTDQTGQQLSCLAGSSVKSLVERFHPIAFTLEIVTSQP